MNEMFVRFKEFKTEFKSASSVLNYFLEVISEEICNDDFSFIINRSEIITKSDELKKIIENSNLLKSEISKSFSLEGYFLAEVKSKEILFIISNKLFKKHEKIIQLLLTIINLMIENILSEEQSRNSKILLDSKIEQLNQLYDLSKEFSGILELEYVSKLLLYSIVGQFLVTNFAIIYEDGSIKVLESKTDEKKVIDLISKLDIKTISGPIFTNENHIEFSKNDFQLIIPMQIKGETKGLILLGSKKNAQSYTQYDIEYIMSVGSLAIISIENAFLFKEALEKQSIERDLETARIIQKNLLPQNFPKSENYEIASYSESAKQVGGDYFDLLTTENDEIVFAIGDVSGKGITASLLVANSQAYLKSITKQNLPISEATSLLNDLVEESTVSGTYITFFWGRLNSKRELTYVNAGHNPPFLLRNGEIKKLEKGGLILGMMKTLMPYESETIQLESGDFIITFTDGVTEAMNSVEEEYSDESLESLCKKLKTENAEEAKEIILNDVKKFTNGFEQSDDLTMLVIKVI